MSSDYRAYILENDSGKRYIGISADVKTRLLQHNEGKSKWTSKYRPWKLAWKSRQMILSEARKLENLLKKQKGGSGISKIIQDFGDAGS
jgi:putative endonuclease